jgi:ADP-heptose:LPS heptosyltransferase
MNLKNKFIIDSFFFGMLIFPTKIILFFIKNILNRNHCKFTNDILIIKLLGGGNLLLSLPGLISLKNSNKRLRLLTTPSVANFAKMIDIFDEIIIINDKSLYSTLVTGIFAFFKCFRTDTVVDLEVYSKATSLFALYIISRNRYSFYLDSTRWKEGISSHLIFFQKYKKIHEHYNEILYFLCDNRVEYSEAKKYLSSKLSKFEYPEFNDKNYCTVGLTCSDLGKERMLTIEDAKNLIIKNLDLKKLSKIYLLGVKSDFTYYESIIKLINRYRPDILIYNKAGSLSLEKSVHLIKLSSLYIGIDSSLLHFARFLSISNISYWGPTDPKTRLYDDLTVFSEINYSNLICSPCIHITLETPCNSNNICMKESNNNKNILWIKS